MATSDKESLLTYLRNHGSITPGEAWEELGIYRLSARIYDLRKDGETIHTENVKMAKRGSFARYHLVSSPAMAV